MASVLECLARDEKMALADALWHRLRGAALDAPYQREFGERPQDVLVPIVQSLSKAGKAFFVERLNAAIDMEFGESPTQDVFGDSEKYTFLRRVVDLAIRSREAELVAAALKWRPYAITALIDGNEEAVENASDLLLEIAERVESKSRGSFNPVLTIVLLLTHAKAPAKVALHLANIWPVPFFEHGFSYMCHISTFRTRQARKDVRAVVAYGFESMGPKLKASRLITKNVLVPWSRSIARTESNRRLVSEVAKGVADAGAPIADVEAIEDSYWNRPDLLVAPESEKYGQFANWVQRILGCDQRSPTQVVNANIPPFAEAALAELWRLVCRAKYGVLVNLVSTPFDETFSALDEPRTIDIAIHNNSIYDQNSTRRGGNLEVSNVCYKFEKYDVLVRSSLAQRFGLGDPVDEDKLARLFKAGKIGAGGSDIYKVAQRRVKSLVEDSDAIEMFGAMEGAQRLIDGKISVLFAGSIQVEYVRRRYPQLTRRITAATESTDVHMYWNDANVNARSLKDDLETAWADVFTIWNRLCKNQTDDAAKLRDHLVAFVNINVDAAVVPDFKSLSNILERHNSKVDKIDSSADTTELASKQSGDRQTADSSIEISDSTPSQDDWEAETVLSGKIVVPHQGLVN